MSNLWKITKCSANAVALFGLSLLKRRSRRINVRVVERNLLSQSNTMARRVSRITVRSMLTIGLWLMVGCIYLVSVLAVIPTVFVLTMWAVANKLSVATDKVKRTLKG